MRITGGRLADFEVEWHAERQKALRAKIFFEGVVLSQQRHRAVLLGSRSHACARAALPRSNDAESAKRLISSVFLRTRKFARGNFAGVVTSPHAFARRFGTIRRAAIRGRIAVNSSLSGVAVFFCVL
jgi:hypothetical protein